MAPLQPGQRYSLPDLRNGARRRRRLRRLLRRPHGRRVRPELEKFDSVGQHRRCSSVFVAAEQGRGGAGHGSRRHAQSLLLTFQFFPEPGSFSIESPYSYMLALIITIYGIHQNSKDAHKEIIAYVIDAR